MSISSIEYSAVLKCPETPPAIVKPQKIESSPLVVSNINPLNLTSSPNSLSNLERPLATKGPVYMLYSDPAIQNAASRGSFSKLEKERLTRGTMSNMVSASSAPPFNRFPKSGEIEEMAKSLVVLYPFLRDAETGHVSTYC